MAATFRPSSRGGSFRRRDFGDLGMARQAEKDQREIDALRQQRNAYAEVHGQNISEMQSVHNLEEQNRAEIHEFEMSKIDQRQKATAIRGQREVEALRGKAAEFGRRSRMWQQFTPTLAKTLSDTAQTFYQKAEDKYLAQVQNEQLASTAYYSGVANEAVELADEDALKLAEDAARRNDQRLANFSVRHSPKARTAADNNEAARHMHLFDDEIQIHLGQIEGLNGDNFRQHAQEYVANVIKLNGWQNSLAPKVIEWRSMANQKIAAMERKMMLTDRQVESSSNYNQRLNIAKKQGITQENVDAAVRVAALIPKDNFGRTTKAEAATKFFTDLASDLSVPIEDIYEGLDMLTPEEGRDKKHPTYALRMQGLREAVDDARAEAEDEYVKDKERKLKFQDEKEKEQQKDWLNNTGIYAQGGEKEGQGWDGTKDQRENMYNWAKQKGLKKTASFIESYAPFDESTYIVGLQTDMIKDVYDQGRWTEALDLIDNAPYLTTEDRNKLKNSFPEIRLLNRAGQTDEKIESTLDGYLRKALGKEFTGIGEGGIQVKVPSLEPTTLKAKNFLLEKFKFYASQGPETNGNLRKAYDNALADTVDHIEKGRTWAEIEPASQSNNQTAGFKMQLPTGDRNEWRTEDAKIQLDSDPMAFETVEIIPTKKLAQVAQAIKSGEPVRIPQWIHDAAIKAKVSTAEFINAQFELERTSEQGTKIAFSQRMNPSAKDMALAGVPTGYLNVADRIKHAHTLVEIQALNDYHQSGGRTPDKVDPAVLNGVSNPQLKATTSSVIPNSETAQLWTEVMGMFPDASLGDVLLFSPDYTEFAVNSQSITYKRLMEAVASPDFDLGITYNPITQKFLTGYN